MASAEEVGSLVALKIVSPDNLHKAKAAGVLAGLNNTNSSKNGFNAIIANAKPYQPDARIDGVHVQQMLRRG